MAKMFMIMSLATGSFLHDGDTPARMRNGYTSWDRPIRIFTNAEEANRVATQFSQICNTKFQLRPVPVSTTEWHQRELGRFADGTYTPLPWNGFCLAALISPQDWKGTWEVGYRSPEAEHHYPHMSEKSPGNIAFTETDAKGQADVQTIMKPGRYLKRYYPRLGEADVKRLANDLLVKFGTVQLKFATTEDEIEAVYTNGPASCMSHRADREFSACGGYHPVRIYAAGDLALAYLVPSSASSPDMEEDSDIPRASARVLCWPAKKLHGRIYGDVQKMGHMIREAGYKEAEGWYFEGAKLIKKFCPRSKIRLIMPYIDGDYKSVLDCGNHLEIHCDGNICAEVTGGYSDYRSGRCDNQECEECGGDFRLSDLSSFRVHPGGTRYAMICNDCTEENTFYCGYSGVYYYTSEGTMVRMGNGDIWHEYYVDRHAFYSAFSSEYWHLEYRVELGNGEYWTVDERHDHAELSATGVWWPKGELVEQPDGSKLHPTEVTEPDLALSQLLDSLNEPVVQEGVTTDRISPMYVTTIQHLALEAEALSPFALPPEGEH
jgi:hypothetical protein